MQLDFSFEFNLIALIISPFSPNSSYHLPGLKVTEWQEEPTNQLL